jgi:CHAT domain-containing protein
MSLEDNDARRVHDWAERGRASALALRPVRPPDDETLAWYLEDLRATVAEIDDARDNGQSTAHLLSHQQEVERSIRDHVRASPGADEDSQPPTPQKLCEQLGDDALVEIVAHEGQLNAVTVVNGRWRLHDLGSAGQLAHWRTHVPFALNRLASSLSTAQSQSAALAVLTKAGDTLQSLLFGPLREVIDERDVVLVPSPELQTVPWAVLPLCRDRLVSVAPSATLWSRAAQSLPANSAPSPVAVVAGPGLPGADREAEAVAALYPNAILLTTQAATADAVSAALGRCQVAHIAAHGQLRSDNPLFSAITLHDGPFTVYDIERLATTPAHVVLAACDTARSHVIGGQEILGLTAAFLGRDTRALVAPVVSVADAQTREVMVGYHRQRSSGSSPRAALGAAQRAAWATGEPRTIASAAAFVCLGSGA